MLGVDQQVETYLESILSGEALVAVSAREGLDSQVDTLVAFEIVISVETLRTLIATERTICLRVLMWHLVAVH